MSSLQFIQRLFSRCGDYRDNGCITLTAIHPDGAHRTPSRHIPLNQPAALHDALHRLQATNALGWGAFVAVGLRRRGLGRYRRGGADDLLALPALFVDVDDASEATLQQLQQMQPKPSCVTFTGGGYHAYWWLQQPLTDMQQARRYLRALAEATGGDSLSPAQSLRLVGTRNTKPGRNNVLCRLIDLRETYHALSDFDYLLPVEREAPETPSMRHLPGGAFPAMLQRVTDYFRQRGYVQRGDWLCGGCIYPEHHKNGDAHPSFGFNIHSGYGNCYVCGSMLLKDICSTLRVDENYIRPG